jgi:hypothetical protein
VAERHATRRRRDDEPDVRRRDRDERGDDGRGGDRRSDDGRTRSRPRRRSPDGELSATDAAQIGVRQISELTGKRPEGITGIEPAEDGWVVGVEVVEDARIPSAADILATYEAELDMSGEMVSYRRVKRYSRGRGDSEG